MQDPDDVIRALRAPDQRNCGRMAGGMGASATDRLACLDAAAESLRCWSPQLVPGLLQTTLTSHCAIKARTPSLPEEELGRRMQSRIRRSENFLRRMCEPGDSHAWLIMGEAALAHPPGPLEFHAHQLLRLLDIIDMYPRITVRVLPDISAHVGPEPFTVHSLADGARVGHVESLLGGWYTTRSEDMARLYSAFALLGRHSLSPEESREVISEWHTRCTRSTGTAPATSSPATATLTTASTPPALPAAPSQ